MISKYYKTKAKTLCGPLYTHFIKVDIDEESDNLFETRVIVSDNQHYEVCKCSYPLSKQRDIVTQLHNGFDVVQKDEFDNALYYAVSIISEQTKE